MVRIGSVLDKILVWFTNLVTSETTVFVVDGPEVSLTTAMGRLEVSEESARVFSEAPTWNGLVSSKNRLDLS